MRKCSPTQSMFEANAHRNRNESETSEGRTGLRKQGNLKNIRTSVSHTVALIGIRAIEKDCPEQEFSKQRFQSKEAQSSW